MREPAPAYLGRYRLVEPLGRGGMGVVYRAEHLDTGQRAALKTVLVPREWSLQSLRREIDALSRLRHPQIVRILEHGLHEGLPWYAMELLEGSSLSHWLEQLFGRTAAAAPAAAALDAPTPARSTHAQSAGTGSWVWWTGSLAGPQAAALAGPELRAVTRPDTAGLQARRLREPATRPALQPPVAGTEAAAPPAAADPPLPAAAAGRLGEVLRLVRSLCVPLAYLHGEGLVHRDLKPANILLRNSEFSILNSESERQSAQRSEIQNSELKIQSSPRPVLVDFGLLAEASGREGRETLDLHALAGGSLHSMAPEQILGEFVDARADLYALGCLLYELLTGRPPFPGSDRAAVVHGHLACEPVPASRLVSGVAPALDELVLRLLAKSPRERLGYASDVAAALSRILVEQDAGTHGPAKPVAGETEAGALSRPYLYRPALAGRAAPLAILREALCEAREGRGTLLLLGGESGVGKTRLARELAREAERTGVRVLTGEGRQTASGGGAAAALEPLRPLLGAVADLCRAHGRAETERLLGRHGKVLAPYAPELSCLPDLAVLPEPVELPPEAARLRLFAALAQTLEALVRVQCAASGEPEAAQAAATGRGGIGSQPTEHEALLLVLDDLQWADELTLDFLGYWQRSGRLGGCPVLCLGTYRSEELRPGGGSSPLQQLLGAPATRGLVLGRLDEEGVGRIVTDMLALRQAPELFVRFLARHSEGNPFFAAEYLHLAVAEGLLWRDGSGLWQVGAPGEEAATETVYEALPLPGGLRDLVGQRLHGLSVAARELVQGAAVLGREFDPSLGAAVAELEPAALLAATQELLTRCVLEEADSSRGALRFAHDKIREVAYAALDEPRRRRLHRAAAAAVEARFGAEAAEHQAELGHHWEQAADPSRARVCYLAGARDGVLRYLYRESERLYRAYLRLVDPGSPESLEARLDLGRNVFVLEGSFDAAIAEFLQVYREAATAGAREFMARGLYGVSHAHLAACRFDQSREAAQAALALFRELGLQNEIGLVLYGLASIHLHQTKEYREAADLYEQALRHHRAARDRAREGTTLCVLALCWAEMGRTDEALELCTAGVSLLEQEKDLNLLATGLHQLGEIHQARDDLEAAVETYERAISMNEAIGARRKQAANLANLGAVYFSLGRVEDTRRCKEESAALNREMGNRFYEAYSLYDLAVLTRLVDGDFGRAGALAREAGALLMELGELADAADCLCEEGHVALALSRSARPFLARLEELVSKHGLASSLLDASPSFQQFARAAAAFETGRHERLFRGSLLDDLPAGLRRWLGEQGLVPREPVPPDAPPGRRGRGRKAGRGSKPGRG